METENDTEKSNWDLVLEFEMIALIFIRAHRTNNFIPGHHLFQNMGSFTSQKVNQTCLINQLCIRDTVPEPPSFFHAKVFDGAAIVHILPTNQATTFDEYWTDT